ncbi:unnamed protein product [Urochloa humidicola]
MASPVAREVFARPDNLKARCCKSFSSNGSSYQPRLQMNLKNKKRNAAAPRLLPQRRSAAGAAPPLVPPNHRGRPSPARRRLPMPPSMARPGSAPDLAVPHPHRKQLPRARAVLANWVQHIPSSKNVGNKETKATK